MGVKGFRTRKGDIGTTAAREFKGARRRITPNTNAVSADIPGGAPKPRWQGQLLGSAIRRPDRMEDLSKRGY